MADYKKLFDTTSPGSHEAFTQKVISRVQTQENIRVSTKARSVYALPAALALAVAIAAVGIFALGGGNDNDLLIPLAPAATREAPEEIMEKEPELNGMTVIEPGKACILRPIVLSQEYEFIGGDYDLKIHDNPSGIDFNIVEIWGDDYIMNLVLEFTHGEDMNFDDWFTDGDLRVLSINGDIADRSKTTEVIGDTLYVDWRFEVFYGGLAGEDFAIAFYDLTAVFTANYEPCERHTFEFNQEVTIHTGDVILVQSITLSDAQIIFNLSYDETTGSFDAINEWDRFGILFKIDGRQCVEILDGGGMSFNELEKTATTHMMFTNGVKATDIELITLHGIEFEFEWGSEF
jgi:hypothetical protein